VTELKHIETELQRLDGEFIPTGVPDNITQFLQQREKQKERLLSLQFPHLHVDLWNLVGDYLYQ
jgi:hypothetical protein